MKINLKFSTSDMWRRFIFLHMRNMKLLHMRRNFKFLQNTDEEKSEILHICQVEKFLHMTDMEKFLHIYHVFGVHFCFVFLHFALKQQFVSQFMLFCRILYCFYSLPFCCFLGERCKWWCICLTRPSKMEVYHRGLKNIIVHTGHMEWFEQRDWKEQQNIIDWVNHIGRIVKYMLPVMSAFAPSARRP